MGVFRLYEKNGESKEGKRRYYERPFRLVLHIRGYTPFTSDMDVYKLLQAKQQRVLL